VALLQYLICRYGSTPGVNEAFSTLGSRSLRYSSNFFSQSCDPLKLLEDESDCVAGQHGQQYQQRSGTMGRHPKPRPPNVALPLDNEDYLVPSPQSPPPATPNTLNNNKNPYMDLIGEPKSSSGMFLYPPPHGYVIPGMHVAPSTNLNNYFFHLHQSS
jgi:hypothetical protein